MTETKTYHVTPIYKKFYKGINCLEIGVDSISIIKRSSDSFVNISNIFRVLKLDNFKSSKFLQHISPDELNRDTSDNSEITWISLRNAIEITKELEIYEILKPLLSTDVETLSDIPTKQELIDQGELITQDITIGTDNKATGITEANSGSLARSFSTLTESDELENNLTSPKYNRQAKSHHTSGMTSPYKKLKISSANNDDDELIAKEKLKDIVIYDHDTEQTKEHFPYSLKPVLDRDDKSKVILSSLFLPNQKEVSLLDLVGGDESQLNGLNIDEPIDDNGQTALHLVSTLGKINLVKELVERGATRTRGDKEGQTALIRAVHAVNCFENNCFDKLLDYLYPAIPILDHKGRTILHHIAYTCGRKGRSDACKYYLETLLEWIVQRGSYLPGDQKLSLAKFMKEVVNIPDRNGDTCLNIAAIVGNKHIITQLIEVGADPTKANNAGVKPIDCGIDLKSLMASSSLAKPQSSSDGSSTDKILSFTGSNGDSETSTNNMIKRNGINGANNGLIHNGKNSSKLLDSLHQFVNQLEENFKGEIETKNKLVDEMYPQYKEVTLSLSEQRKRYETLSKTISKISEYKSKISNLNKAIEAEEESFRKQSQSLPQDIEFGGNYEGDFDADEPFTVLSVFSEVQNIINDILQEEKLKNSEKLNSPSSTPSTTNANVEIDEESLMSKITPEMILERMSEESKSAGDIPPAAVLEARISAYKENNKSLVERAKIRHSSSTELEQQFKRVIALCIHATPEAIDEKLINSLLSSVENDPDPEISQIKKVLKIVNDLESN